MLRAPAATRALRPVVASPTLARSRGEQARELRAGRGEAEAALEGAGVVAADRDDEQVVRPERAAHPRKGRRAAAGEEGLVFGDEARDAGSVDVAVVGEGAADREIVVLHREQLRHGVDEIGAARETAGVIDGGRRDAEQLEQIAGVRIGIAEGDDPRHPLRRGRRRSQAGGR